MIHTMDMDPRDEVPIPQQQRSSVIVSRNHSLYPPSNHPSFPSETLYSKTFRNNISPSQISYSSTFTNKQSGSTKSPSDLLTNGYVYSLQSVESPSDLSINGHIYSPQSVDSPSDLSINGHLYSPQSPQVLPGLTPYPRRGADTLEGVNHYNSRDEHYKPIDEYDGRDENYDDRDEQDSSRDESSSWISNGSWVESPAPHNSSGYPSDLSRSPAAPHNSTSYPSDVSSWDLERSTFLPSTSRAFQKDKRNNCQFMDKRDNPQFMDKRENSDFMVPIPPKKRVLHADELRGGTYKTGRWNESNYVNKMIHSSKQDYIKPADIAQVKNEPHVEKPESQAHYSSVATSHRQQEDPLNIDSKSSPAFANLSLQGYSQTVPCTTSSHIKIEVEESNATEITVDETQENESSVDEAKEDKRPVADCHVCGDKAIAHMHYGGICCYSCKAFFRRAVQSGKDSKYTCKKNNECQITVLSRRSCQKCRFVRCVSIGMIPNWVLSDEQCQIRFGNRGKEGLKETTEKGSSVGVNETRVCLISDEPSMFFTQEESLRLKFLMKMYEASNETINYSEKNPAVWQKVFNPSSNSEDNLTGKDLSNLVGTVIEKNIFLIQHNNDFKQLCREDQLKLIKKNMNEICLYHGAIRFDCNTKNFVWNISTKDDLARISDNTRPSPLLKKPPVISKNALRNLYAQGSGMADYIVRTIEAFARLHLPVEVYLLLIHICAFSSDGLVLQDRKTVERMQNHYLLDLHRYLIHRLGNAAAAVKFGQVMSAMADLRECSDKSPDVKLNNTRTALEQSLTQRI